MWRVGTGIKNRRGGNESWENFKTHFYATISKGFSIATSVALPYSIFAFLLFRKFGFRDYQEFLNLLAATSNVSAALFRADFLKMENQLI